MTYEPPHQTTLSAEDTDKVIFALDTVNLEDLPPDTTYAEDDFNALSKRLAEQAKAGHVITVLSEDAAAIVVTALGQFSEHLAEEGSDDRTRRFTDAIESIFMDAIHAAAPDAAEEEDGLTREMPLPSHIKGFTPDEAVAERIATAFESIAGDVRRGRQIAEAFVSQDSRLSQFLRNVEAEQHRLPPDR